MAFGKIITFSVDGVRGNRNNHSFLEVELCC